MTISEKLQAEIVRVTAKLWPDFKLPPFDLVNPPSSEFGDLSTPMCLTLAKLIGKPPMELAKELKNKLDSSKLEYVKEITVTNPGYLNIFLDFPALGKHLFKRLFSQKAEFGKSDDALGFAIVEHTSVNPNKAAHIGHLRNACLGDTVARILSATGWQVEVQNYIDDTGVQVADVLVALNNLKDKQGKQRFDYFCWDIYSKIQKLYETDDDLKKQREDMLKALEQGNNDKAKRALEVANQIVDCHIQTMARLNIAYNLFVWERDILDNQLWPKVFEELKSKQLIKQSTTGEHKGAWIVEFGKEERENKIMVRSNGVPTYTAKDLAYQLWKFGALKIDWQYYLRQIQWNKLPLLTTPAGAVTQKRKKKAERKSHVVNKVINVIDDRQSYPQEVIKETLGKLGFKKEAQNSVHLSYNTVRLSLGALKDLGIHPEQDKDSYAMSGREGIGVKIDDLIDKVQVKIKKINPELSDEDLAQIASGTIRYYILRNRTDKEIIFDFDDALQTNGNTGVYLQYAFARCHNILSKVTKWHEASEKIVWPTDLSDENKTLIKLLESYPKALKQASDELDPSLLTDFAFNLANAFAKFYEKNPVLKADEDTKRFRLHLVAAVKQVLSNIMDLLNIQPLTKI